MSAMNILITGGNGYVGRVLTRLLMREHSVCVIDNQRYGSVRFKPEELEHFHLVNADIRDKEKISGVIDKFKPEVLIHLAAIHYIPECESLPAFSVSTNIEGTVNLLSLCPSDCRFVFASSGAVYLPQDTPHHETKSPIGPMDVYGLTKLQGEEYVKYFSRVRGFPAAIVRLFNVVGPGETNPHLLPEIFAQLQSGIRTLKLGNITPKRDYINVNDAASGFWSVSSRGEILPGTVTTVNLGTSNQYSVSEILEKIKTISNIDFEVVQDPQRIRQVDRPYLAANIDSIQRLFGWSPQFNIDDTIRSLVENPDLPNQLTQKYRL
jgi:UDP-glucose 4-epimerase